MFWTVWKFSVLTAHLHTMCSMGFCILLVQGVATLSHYMKTTRLQKSLLNVPTWPFYLALVLVGVLATRTVVRNGDWQTQVSLFRYASSLPLYKNFFLLDYEVTSFPIILA